MAVLSPVPSRTLARPVTLDGVGLFCPDHCSVTISPAPAGSPPGIHFQRLDIADAPWIPACASRVIARPRQTVLAPADPAHRAATVQTVEHLMSALVALGITDALITVRGPEIPLTDGSALPFARAILQAGIVTAASSPGHQPLVITQPFTLEDRGTTILAEPHAPHAPYAPHGPHAPGGPGGPGSLKTAPGAPPTGPRFEATYILDYGPDAPIAPQRATFCVDYLAPDRDAYIRDIAPARTFATQTEAQHLRAAGLFTHLSPADIPIIGPHGPVIGSARFDNEPARHKVLDLLGDLGLAGRPIHGRITATRSGHALNHAMAAALTARARS